jgi:hypothetical protein
MRPYIKVGWFTQAATTAKANVWRILDLSGMTTSVRQSLNFTKAGVVFLDGSRVSRLEHTVELGKVFTLQLRFPNGVVKTKRIMLVPITRSVPETPRLVVPTYTRYRG